MRDRIVKRFLKYVSFHTTSEFGKENIPSTTRQFDMAKYLVEELKGLGLEDVSLDENGYVMATLPSNTEREVPTIGFVAHMDTSPDFSGENVNPQFHENYAGQPILLNKDEKIVLDPEEFPEMLLYKGQTLITTDGTTLLGADDKAGVTEIVSAMEYMLEHPEIEHGKIRVCITPDEEVGRGADKFDVDKFGAEWAYTIDGGRVGELEYESFNAAYAKLSFAGKMVHPGEAKNKMRNSMLVASSFIKALPADEIPERTDERQGFFHLTSMEGGVEKTTLEYIVRDHDRNIFNERKEFLEKTVKRFNEQYGEGTVELRMFDQYYNMGEKIKPVFHVVETVEEVMKDMGITPIVKPIRGGTDGSRLSFMGLPCPNIFAGGHNFHGRYEYVAVESMELATDLICKVAVKTMDKFGK
ncbi:MAG: peptidase T [Cytophagales bacterium]|nr:peptidase T [Cytophagales bacterium]